MQSTQTLPGSRATASATVTTFAHAPGWVFGVEVWFSRSGTDISNGVNTTPGAKICFLEGKKPSAFNMQSTDIHNLLTQKYS